MYKIRSKGIDLLKNFNWMRGVNNRPEIREYAESFAWKKVVEEYYVPAMEKIIAQ